jgi:uncharacterized cupredoxin-like copper-binding protein
MHRKRLGIAVAVFVVCSMGLTAWFLGAATGPAGAQARVSTTIVVTAGKPSEFGFKLSKFSLIPAGTVIFKVSNKGKAIHDFKLCSKATGGSLNSCTGSVTRRLAPGQSATLTVTLKKSGKYEFLCTVPGHANAGMKGLLGIGVAVTAKPHFTFATGPTATGAATGATPGATCANPQSTTITVKEFEMAFTLSQNSVPCGSITFVQTNTGTVNHNFSIAGGTPAAAGVGAFINPGQTTTNTVTLTPGTYAYKCDIPEHGGMNGTLLVN